MSTKLYEEALAEAKKLKQVAEANATKKIMESMAPKIRMLIEQELEDDSEDDGEMIEEPVDDASFQEPVEDSVEDTGSGEYEGEYELEYQSDIEDLSSNYSEPMQDMSVAPEDMEEEEETTSDEDDEYIDSDRSFSVGDDEDVVININVESLERTKILQNRAKFLTKKLRETKSVRSRKKIVSELRSIRKKLIIIEEQANSSLRKNITKILKEKTNMPNFKGRGANRRNWRLFEGEGGDEDLDMELEDEAGEDEEMDVDVDAIRSAVEDLAAAVGMEVEEEGEEDLEDLEYEDAEGEDEDLEEYDEMDEMDDMDEMYEMDDMDEADHDDMDEADHDDMDEVVEINESMLKRELIRMNRAKRSRQLAESRRKRAHNRRRRLRESEAKEMAGHFGGGSLDKEMFIDVDEATLLNALEEELGSMDNAPDAGGSPSKVANHFGGGTIKKGVVPESVRRSRRAQRLAERKAAKAMNEARRAKKELRESNLFNQKLVYVNKIMQQHTLNKKQQRAIVEALDNARSLKEAKLLFESLSQSLENISNKSEAKKASGRLSEGLVRSGSSSKSTQSAAPAKNSVELDRWATLAGIK